MMHHLMTISLAALALSACAEHQARAQGNATGYLLSGCARLEQVSVCRRNDAAYLEVAGVRTRLLEGYLADDQTSYALSRQAKVYRIRLGWPGVSDNPMHSSYSIELKAGDSIELMEIKDEGDMRCGKTLVRYSMAMDAKKREVTYKIYEDDEGDAREFVAPFPPGTRSDSISYDDHLVIAASLKGPSKEEMCAGVTGKLR